MQNLVPLEIIIYSIIRFAILIFLEILENLKFYLTLGEILDFRRMKVKANVILRSEELFNF